MARSMRVSVQFGTLAAVSLLVIWGTLPSRTQQRHRRTVVTYRGDGAAADPSFIDVSDRAAHHANARHEHDDAKREDRSSEGEVEGGPRRGEGTLLRRLPTGRSGVASRSSGGSGVAQNAQRVASTTPVANTDTTQQPARELKSILVPVSARSRTEPEQVVWPSPYHSETAFDPPQATTSTDAVAVGDRRCLPHDRGGRTLGNRDSVARTAQRDGSHNAPPFHRESRDSAATESQVTATPQNDLVEPHDRLLNDALEKDGEIPVVSIVPRTVASREGTSPMSDAGEEHNRFDLLDGEITLPASVRNRIADTVQQAFKLGERRAYYSAQADFHRALRAVAQAFDAETSSEEYTNALARGMRALEEAEDFQATTTRLDRTQTPREVAAAHRTDLLRHVEQDLTALEALQLYFTYAERQLAMAGGAEPVAAEAWYGLAKLLPELNVSGDNAVWGPRAIALYRVAQRINPQHALAAHELGVMLARYGELDAAREQLEASIAMRPMSTTWRNLSVVYEQLGDLQQARHASVRAEQAKDVGDRMASRTIRFVDPDEFARNGSEYPDTAPRNPETQVTR